MQHPLPRLTVVTPSYNQGCYLEETLCSILDQGYPNLELIVIDGGSSDNSVQILRKYSNKLSYWVSERDGGQSDALRKGFERATGDVLAFLNSDDVFSPNALFEVARCLRGEGGGFLASFPGVEFDEDGVEDLRTPPERVDLWHWINSEASLFQPGVFFSRAAYEAVGGIDSTMRFAFDKDFFIRVIFGGARFLPFPDCEPVARFRLHNQSKTSTLSEVRAAENSLIRERVLSSTQLRPFVRDRMDEAAVSSAVAVALSSDSKFQALSALFECVKGRPKLLGNRMLLGALRRVLIDGAGPG
jgi:glycosyltransferase involved in cell wall biosynthesis